MRLARSYLFVPGSHQRLLEKAFAAGADAIVIDLEDAVALPHKALARELVATRLAGRQRTPGSPVVIVRINSVASGLWQEDLAAVVGPGLDGIRLANTESPDDVGIVSDAIARHERRRGLPHGAIGIIPSIESATAALAAAAIAQAPRVTALAFGATDFLHDIGAGPDAGDVETLAVRTHLVLVSRAAGIAPPIAPVHPRLEDLDELRRSSLAARRLGFFGRSCIHPAQLTVVHEVFTPTPAEVSDALAIVEASASRDPGGGVRLPDGRLIADYLVHRARAVIELSHLVSATKTAPAS